LVAIGRRIKGANRLGDIIILHLLTLTRLLSTKALLEDVKSDFQNMKMYDTKPEILLISTIF
jgi:hypothetical protein